MDVIFDIDGTLADATHRLHLIKDPAFWVHLKEGKPLTPDWVSFLSDEQVAKDTPIPQTWFTMLSLLVQGARVLFITGRNENSRSMTTRWLLEPGCEVRGPAVDVLESSHDPIMVYMRSHSDRRTSDEVKQELLNQARYDGFDPKMVFEDREDDTVMWRRNGLLCCQVAEGKY